jgi:hypothetical protein
MSMDDYIKELDRLGEDGFNDRYRPILQGILDQVFAQQEAQ